MKQALGVPPVRLARISQRVGVELVAPWEEQAAGTARRLFPLLLRWKVLAAEAGAGPGVEPIDSDHRMIRAKPLVPACVPDVRLTGLLSRVRELAPVIRRKLLNLIDPGVVFFVRDRKPVDVESLQLQRAPGRRTRPVEGQILDDGMTAQLWDAMKWMLVGVIADEKGAAEVAKMARGRASAAHAEPKPAEAAE